MVRTFPLWVVLALGALLLSTTGEAVIWPSAALILSTLALLSWMRARKFVSRGTTILRLVLLVLLCAASLMGLRLSSVASREDGVWLRLARTRLDTGAERVRSSLLELERNARARAREALLPNADLELLSRSLRLASTDLEIGISRWENGQIIDWAGQVPGPERVAPGPRPLLVDHGFRRYLTVSAQDAQGRVAYLDVSLGITRELFPRLGVGVDPGRLLSGKTGLQVSLRAAPPEPEEITGSLERVVAVPEEDPWAWVILTAPGAREERRMVLEHEGRVLALLLLAAFLVATALAWRGWSGRRVNRRSVATAAALALLVLVFRFGIDRAQVLHLAFTSEHGLMHWLLEPAYFATTWGFGLLRSVLDFFCSSLALALVLLLLLPSWLYFLREGEGRVRRWTGAILLLLLSGAALAWLYTLQRVVAQNANPKLIGLDAPFFTLPFQVLHWAMLLALLAPVGFVFLGWERWLRHLRFRHVLALVAGLLLGAAVLLLDGGSSRAFWAFLLPIAAVSVSRAMQHPSFSVRVVAALALILWLSATQAEGLRQVYRGLKESVATERALDRLHPRDNWRRVLVEELLRELSQNTAQLRQLADPNLDRSNVAFELWASSSSLSALGYGSHIVLLDAAGKVLSDFDLGLPYQAQPVVMPTSRPIGAEPFGVKTVQVQSARGTFLVYRGWLDLKYFVPNGDASWLRVDLPYGTTDPAAPIDFKPTGGPSALGFATGRDLLSPRQEFEQPVIMGRMGEKTVIAATDPVLVGLPVSSLAQDGSWHQVRRKGTPYQAQIVGEDGERLVVAFALPTANERLLDATRLVALYLVAGALGLMCLLLLLALRPGSPRWPASLGRLGYQERLLGAMVVLVLLPVIVFGVFQSRRASANLRRSNMEEVTRRLDTALRLLANGLDDALRIRLDTGPVHDLLSTGTLQEQNESAGNERDQVTVFDPSGEMIYDESHRELAPTQKHRLLQLLSGAVLVLEDDSTGWYLGRLYHEPGSDNQSYSIYLRRRIEDEDLGRVAHTVGVDLTLFDGAWAVVSSRDDLFKAGLIVPVLPADAQRLLRRGGSPRYVTTEPGQGLVVARAYTIVPGPGEQRRGVLAGRLFTQATVAALEQRRSYLFLFGLSSLAFLLATAAGLYLAARTVNPILVLLGATRRVGAGELDVRLPEKGDDEIGELTHSFNLMTRDLEQSQRSLAARRSFLEAMLGGLSAGVLVLDPEFAVVESNPAAAKLEETETQELLTQLKAQDLSQQTNSTEVVLTGEDTPRTLRAVISPIQLEADRPGWLLLFDDVTELLSSRRLALYAEMARQVAHEVKNPLTPIQLAAQMVRQACHDDHPRKEQIVDDSVEQIERQVQRLREIASEFSLLGRPDLPELVAVELGDLLREVQLLYPSPDQSHELRIHGGEGIHVLANREAMLKILTNLVENAWQAMGGSGTVEISATVEGEKVQLRVVDEGPGISPEAEERLFEAYFSTKSYGTGLGLVICRNLTEKMGGRIHLTNRSDHRGASAVVELPRYHPTTL